MKYYTKKWYEMLHRNFHLDLFEIVPDENYSEEKIYDLYEKKIQGAIEEERKLYDKFSQVHIFDYHNKKIDKQKKDIDEMIYSLEESEDVSRKVMDNENVCDKSAIEENFKAAYEVMLTIINSYPEWVIKEVDPKLLAMGFMPYSIYRKLKLQHKENRKAFKAIDSKAKKETDLQWSKIPAEIRKIFRNEDCSVLEESCLLSLNTKENDILLTFRYGEWQKPTGNITPYICIIFKNGKLLENEAKIQLMNTSPMEKESIISDCMYVKDELYLIKNNYYEYHLMVAGWSYITILCNNIECQQNYKPFGKII